MIEKLKLGLKNELVTGATKTQVLLSPSLSHPQPPPRPRHRSAPLCDVAGDRGPLLGSWVSKSVTELAKLEESRGGRLVSVCTHAFTCVVVCVRMCLVSKIDERALHLSVCSAPAAAPNVT